MSYDFSGWATKNDLKCADGLVIRKDAFKSQNGCVVPLIWNHQHNSPSAVLGHALLTNKDDGVWAECEFNNSPKAQEAKEGIMHGDITHLSIWANNLQQIGNDIMHGVIREVSLVLAGANPGARIESVITHGMSIDEGEDEAIIYTNDTICISHAIEDKPEDDDKKKEPEKKEEPKDGEGKSVKEVIDTMNDDQKKAMAIVVGQAIKDAKGEDKKEVENEGGSEMKHSAFEGNNNQRRFISHSDMETVINYAKEIGSMKKAVDYHIQNGVLAHSIDTTGMDTATGKQTYGFNDPSMLFPDYKSLNNPPEWISRNMDWVNKVMSKVHHTPFSRIKSVYADITEDEARAKGYIKGKQKKDEVFSTLKRTTSPQTVYKRQKMDRDDIIDITDFDVIAWIKAEMRVMLDEELARAFLIGDGRPADSEDKIHEINIRPVVKDVPLFNTIIKVTVPSDADEEFIAKATIKAIIRGRKKYKGSGKPDFWTNDDVITEMLLLEDAIGHSVYKTESELSTKLRVNEIIPVELMEGQTVTVNDETGSHEYPLIGTIVNMDDYNVGADKGGQVEMFDDFDINFNQFIYLIETRCSGALIKPFSALTIVLDKGGVASGASVVSDEQQGA